MLRTIRARRYDLVINLTEGDRGAIAAAISGARIRVGPEHKESSLSGKRRMITHAVKQAPGRRHTVERDLDALRRIGIFPAPDERKLFFSIPEQSRQNILDQLTRARITPGSYILLHPTSRWLFKCWTIDGVAKLMRALANWAVPIVISGSADPMERAMIDRIVTLCPNVPMLDLAGRINLKELGALIDMSRGLFCVDSVPMHIASALQKPTVVVFGPSSEIDWGPWRNPSAQVITQNFSCRPCGLDGCGGGKVSDCLDTLSADVVIPAVRSMLDQRFTPANTPPQ